MSFTVSVYMNEPPTLLLDLTAPQNRTSYHEHINVLGRVIHEQGWQDERVYLIIDSCKAPVTFTNVMDLFAVHLRRRDERGSAGDPLLISCFVGTHPLLTLAGQFLAKVNEIRPMLFFSTREEAASFYSTHYSYYKTSSLKESP